MTKASGATFHSTVQSLSAGVMAVFVVERLARSLMLGWLNTAGILFKSVPLMTFAARSAPPASSTSTERRVPAMELLVKVSAFQCCFGTALMTAETIVPLERYPEGASVRRLSQV